MLGARQVYSPDASLHTELRSPCTSLPWRGDARSVQGVWQLRCTRVATSARSLGAATETAWRAEHKALRTTRGNLRRVLIQYSGGGKQRQNSWKLDCSVCNTLTKCTSTK